MHAIKPTLGPERRRYWSGPSGLHVRLSDDIRKTVLFFGYEDNSAPGGIRCVGTGFLFGYQEAAYVVTVGHLAHQLSSDPFVLRVNRKDGTAENVQADAVKWYFHPMPSVDVAVMPIDFSDIHDYHALFLPDQMLLPDPKKVHPQEAAIGIGDLTYTIGLFRLMSGKSRNLPIVHSGTIAMMPSDELIPMKDWRDPDATIYVEGYLVEANSLDGLSGSPVFVRPTTTISVLPGIGFPDPRFTQTPAAQGLVPTADIRILGLWQGAWNAPPDDVMAIQAGRNVRVSVGLGVVVPAHKIAETLDHPELVEWRRVMKERRNAQQAAELESAIPANAMVGAHATDSEDANPDHREDFTRLVGAASRKKPQAD